MKRLPLLAVLGVALAACAQQGGTVQASTPTLPPPESSIQSLARSLAACPVRGTVHALSAATAGLLLFTAKPLNVPPAGTQLCRWLTTLSVPAVLPPGDQQWVSLTSTSAHQPRTASATRRRSGSRHLIVLSTGTAAASANR